MISFVAAVIVLLFGFIIYGRFTERIFAPDERITPAEAMKDGVDYVP